MTLTAVLYKTTINWWTRQIHYSSYLWLFVFFLYDRSCIVCPFFRAAWNASAD